MRGVHMPAGVYLPGGVPAQELPCGQTDMCKNITFANFAWGGNDVSWRPTTQFFSPLAVNTLRHSFRFTVLITQFLHP